MYKAMPPRVNTDRLCVWRKKGRKGLNNIEDCVDLGTRGIHKEKQR